MAWLLWFSLGLNIVCTIGMLAYSFLLWRFKAPSAVDGFMPGDRVTAPWTWSFKFGAVLIQAVQLGWSIFYINGIQVFLSAFPPEALIISYLMAGVMRVMLFLFVANSYYAVRRRFMV